MASPEVRKLSISLHADGSVTVEGPMEDKVLCYGLLEFARDQIQNFAPTKIITPPTPSRKL